MHHPTDRITHTTAFVTPVVKHWLEQEIAQWVHRTMSEHSYPCIKEKYSPYQSVVAVDARKEGNVLFNDTLSTFCLRLYGIRHMVTDY